jgi:hypothetical protein
MQLIQIPESGFKWQRQLIFRSKLTMHTAYDRPDNSEPASITAIAISKSVHVSLQYIYLFVRPITTRCVLGITGRFWSEMHVDECIHGVYRM